MLCIYNSDGKIKTNEEEKKSKIEKWYHYSRTRIQDACHVVSG